MLVHPKDGHSKVFCVLHAYLDDSGSHAQAPILILAGYYGSENQWKKFDLQWRKAIDSEGLREFHANRFWAHYRGECIPEYKGWDKQKCVKVISKLLGIIGSYRIFPVSSAVVMSDWRALPKDEKAVLTGASYNERGKLTSAGAPNKTYFLPFAWSIGTALKYCNPGHVMQFSFDRNDYISSYALDYFNTLKQVWGPTAPKMGEIFFVDSERATPIQAADLLAYEAHRYANARLRRNMATLNFNGILEKAISNKRDDHDFSLFGKASLDVILRAYRKAKEESS